ncbi:histidinol-phosphate transaminase [bacterium]|nr:histidinol-phosphate transaminase [bacterium]
MNSNQKTSPSPRPFLDGLEAYVPGEQPRGGGWVKLNTNEFPYPAAPQVLEAIRREAADTVRIYPDPTSTALREKLAQRNGVEPDQILVGNGSDEILRLIAHAFLGPDRPLAMVLPTYTLYEVLASQFGAETRIHKLIDLERLPDSIYKGDWTACFLPAPNAQIGTAFPIRQLERLANAGGLLVLDGAYIDFAPGYDPLKELKDHPAVIHTRTFSKSFGLAGVRVGCAIGPKPLIAALHKLRDSYNVNRLSQAAAIGALEGADYYAARCAEIIESRKMMTRELEKRGFVVPESHGNFVFARRADAPALYEKLKARKILVRYFRHSGLEGGMRITIGTPEENQALLDGIDAIGTEC